MVTNKDHENVKALLRTWQANADANPFLRRKVIRALWFSLWNMRPNYEEYDGRQTYPPATTEHIPNCFKPGFYDHHADAPEGF